MPSVGRPSANLSDFIASVQTDFNQRLLSKADAAAIYQTRENAASASESIDENSQKIEQMQLVDSNLLSNISGVAPRGHSDLWQLATGPADSCLFITYFPSVNRLYSSSGFPNTHEAYYSTDGGANWSGLNFNLNPINPVYIGYNNAGLYIALTWTNEYTRIFTSEDGVNFENDEHNIPLKVYCYNVEYFKGLFIVSVDADANHLIWTSPDGRIWTPRVTPTTSTLVNAITFASDGNQIIGVTDSYSGAMRSFDGITWQPVFGITTGIATIAYSAEQKIWLCFSPNGVGFTSADGLNWTNIGTIVPTVGVIGLIWVGNNINRWYLAGPALVSHNYSLWSTHDPRISPFFNSELDGAIVNLQAYSQIRYVPSFDRFVIGLSYIGAAYSTPRIRDIKASSNNIRVRNSPVKTSKYSAAVDFNIASTAAETVIAPTTNLGSLMYQAAQPVGMKINISLVLRNTSAAGDTLTLRLKTQAGALITHAIPVAGGSTSLPARVKITLIVRTSSISCCSTVMQSAIASSTEYATPAYNPLIANTFSMTAQWGAALSTCAVSQFNVSTDFINGA